MPNSDSAKRQGGIKAVAGRMKQRKWDRNNAETAIKEGRITRKEVSESRKKVAAEKRAKGHGKAPGASGSDASGRRRKRKGVGMSDQHNPSKRRPRYNTAADTPWGRQTKAAIKSRQSSTDDSTPTLRRGT